MQLEHCAGPSAEQEEFITRRGLTEAEVKEVDANNFPAIINKKEKKKKNKEERVNEKGKGKKDKKNQDEFSCNICDKELGSKQSLEIHVISAHLVNSEEYKDMEERYILHENDGVKNTCNKCQKTFNKQQTMYHLMKAHR